MALKLGFSDSESTKRGGTQTQFPDQFINQYRQTLGGPLTTGDLFNLAPRGHSLFGFNAGEGQLREGGGFNFGYGAPTPATAQALGTVGAGGPPPPSYSTVDTPTTSPGPVHTLADITQAYANDPDKQMDLQRFFQQAGLDPNGFTTRQYMVELGRAGQYGFSGRSRGNLSDALAYLQRQDQGGEQFGAGKGTGIF